ncbi:surface antigen-domain-containing protein [Hygrophoropsis aurantiaca]|uniref:Surface antigen-domain-containing protein n=1 Tax=Hygrophoropsis aurantiaca TaxID=72124 RepID=A0ACB8ADG8_9AGAM|nr:surface antigen-domain-containing protein [Hygrophoropsis aurantiaca]
MDGLKPPLQHSAQPGEPAADDLEKIRKWQEARIERKLQGEYESAAFHLADLVNQNLSTPLRVATVRIEGAAHTRRSFLGWLIDPWLPRPTFQDSESLSNLETVLHTTRGISHVLQETDIFQSIEAKLERARDLLAKDGDVDIVFKTREKGRFYLKTATELGNNEGTASATARIRNVFGGAETFEANMSLGTKTRRSFHALLSVPLSPSFRTKGEISLFGLERDLTSYASSFEGSRGLKATVRSDWGSRGIHEVSYEAVLRHLGGLTPAASVSIRESAGQNFKSSLSHTWIRDTRDDKLTASRGQYTKLYQEIAGLGGDTSFYKVEAEGQASRSLLPGVALSFAARTGFLKSLTGQSHFSDRFQLGGPLSIRSFRANSMGPRDSADSLGGEMYWSTGLSLISDIPRKSHWPIKSHFFVNAGRLDSVNKGPSFAVKYILDPNSQSISENLIDCLSKPSVSVGLGLIYRFDPVRVEVNFGVPLVASKSDGARKGFQVGIGLDLL